MLDRSNTVGPQLRKLCEETRTANVSLAPEVTHLQAREAQLFTRVSTMRSQETELHGQFLNLQKENARINALMNQILVFQRFDGHWKSGLVAAIADVKP